MSSGPGCAAQLLRAQAVREEGWWWSHPQHLSPLSPGDSCLNWWQNSRCPYHRKRVVGPLREGGRWKSFQSLQQHFHLPSPVICALGCADSSAHWTPHQHIRANSLEGTKDRRDQGCSSLPSGLIRESLVDSWP